MKVIYAHLYDAKFHPGGAEKVVLDLIRGMTDQRGIEVACAVNPGDMLEELTQRQIKCFPIEWSKLKTFVTIQRLLQAVKEFKPDVLHSHHRYTTFLADIFLKNNVSILHTEHVLRHNKRLFSRFGDMTTAVHETVRQNLIDYYGVTASKVVTIPNATYPMSPDPVKIDALRKQYPDLKNCVKLLCVGRLDVQKGHSDLIEAIGLLPVTVRNRLKVILAGDGPLQTALKSQVASKGLQECFCFLGYSQDIAEWYSICDFLVLPSLWEGLPLTVLEAYSAGRAVIATDIPGSRDIVKNQQTGLLVPSCDPQALSKAIRYFSKHSEDVARMGQAAYELWKREFSFSNMIDKYYACYGSIIQSYGKRR